MVQERCLDGSDTIPTAERKVARLKTGTLENRNSCGTQPSTNDPREGTDASIALAPPISKAVKFNAHTLKKLQAAFDNDPEADLLTNMPPNYSIRLARFQKDSPKKAKETISRFNGRARSIQG